MTLTAFYNQMYFKENILIYPKGKEGQNGIKVIDFGSSCYESERSKFK